MRSHYVILVDDDPDDRDFFCFGMQRHYPGVEVLAFNDGDELLEFLNDPALFVLPDYILLDYKMPRYTGPQLLEAIGAGTRCSSIPKIVWSTSQRLKDGDDCLSRGAVRFVIKPATDRELDELIHSLGCWLHDVPEIRHPKNSASPAKI